MAPAPAMTPGHKDDSCYASQHNRRHDACGTPFPVNSRHRRLLRVSGEEVRQRVGSYREVHDAGSEGGEGGDDEDHGEDQAPIHRHTIGL